MDIAGEAVKLVRKIHRLYFETREYEKILPYFEKEARILSGAAGYVDINGAVKRHDILKQMGSQAGWRLAEDRIETEVLSDRYCYAGGSLFIVEESGREQTVLFSALLERDGERLRISRMQWSVPPIQLEKLLEERTAQLLERSGELKILSDNVPGGVVRLCYDKNMTILYASSGFYRMLGFDPEEVQGFFHNCFWNMIHPEDKAKVLQSWKAQLEYGDKITAEFRMKCPGGGCMWILFNGQFITDLDGSHIFFGVLVDINKERQQQQVLKEQAQLDPLTGVYNKLMAHYEVEDYLTSGQADLCGAFLMIDIDNFKDINDSFGHMFGDVVLEDIAAELKELFSPSDIIGRFGGDEFIVFMKDIESRDQALTKAGLCNGRLNRLAPGGNSFCRLSCSIGIAFAPEHGKNFQELYGKADKALYRAKRKGKNRFSVYEDGIIMQDLSLPRTITVPDSGDREGNSGTGLEKLVFNMLYEAADIHAALASALQITGEYFDVSRAYIFEYAGEEKGTGSTLEWCSAGVTKRKDKLNYAVYEAGIKNYCLNFNEDGVFFCRDVHMLPEAIRPIFEDWEVCSLLQCAIMDNGVFRGFVGVDECREQRCWDQRQIETLSFLARVFSVFLLKNKNS